MPNHCQYHFCFILEPSVKRVLQYWSRQVPTYLSRVVTPDQSFIFEYQFNFKRGLYLDLLSSKMILSISHYSVQYCQPQFLTWLPSCKGEYSKEVPRPNGGFMKRKWSQKMMLSLQRWIVDSEGGFLRRSTIFLMSIPGLFCVFYLFTKT